MNSFRGHLGARINQERLFQFGTAEEGIWTLPKAS